MAPFTLESAASFDTSLYQAGYQLAKADDDLFDEAGFSDSAATAGRAESISDESGHIITDNLSGSAITVSQNDPYGGTEHAEGPLPESPPAPLQGHQDYYGFTPREGDIFTVPQYYPHPPLGFHGFWPHVPEGGEYRGECYNPFFPPWEQYPFPNMTEDHETKPFEDVPEPLQSSSKKKKKNKKKKQPPTDAEAGVADPEQDQKATSPVSPGSATKDADDFERDSLSQQAGEQVEPEDVDTPEGSLKKKRRRKKKKPKHDPRNDPAYWLNAPASYQCAIVPIEEEPIPMELIAHM